MINTRSERVDEESSRDENDSKGKSWSIRINNPSEMKRCNATYRYWLSLKWRPIGFYLENKLCLAFYTWLILSFLFMQMNINCMQLHSYKAYISGFSHTLPCWPNMNSSNDDQHFHTDHLNTCYRMLCTWPAYNQDLSCIPRYVTRTNIFLHNLYSHSKKIFSKSHLSKTRGAKTSLLRFILYLTKVWNDFNIHLI